MITSHPVIYLFKWDVRRPQGSAERRQTLAFSSSLSLGHGAYDMFFAVADSERIEEWRLGQSTPFSKLILLLVNFVKVYDDGDTGSFLAFMTNSLVLRE